MQFIEYRPNVILVHENGNVSVIREAENLETMISQDRLPEHLACPFPSLGRVDAQNLPS
jgi:diaminopimelate decarboxylase